MSRKTKPTNLTLSEATKNKGRDLIASCGYKNLTALVEELLRQKHEQVFGLSPTTAASSPGGERAEAANVVHEEMQARAATAGESAAEASGHIAHKAAQPSSTSHYPKKKPSNPKSKAN